MLFCTSCFGIICTGFLYQWSKCQIVGVSPVKALLKSPPTFRSGLSLTLILKQKKKTLNLFLVKSFSC